MGKKGASMINMMFHGYGYSILSAYSMTLIVMSLFWIVALLSKRQATKKVKRYLSQEKK